jgi:thymidylate synthase (FAD)
MCVEIETTRDVSPQILRHRSFSFQEFSQRYASVTEHLKLDAGFELRLQDTTNRQSSLPDAFGQLAPYRSMIENHFKQAEHLYASLLSAGCAKEVARKVLPMAAPTRMYMAGTLRSWIHYCQVRADNATQKEHRQIAIAIWKILSEQCPSIAAAVHELRSETT